MSQNMCGETRSRWIALGGIVFLIALCLLIGAGPLEADGADARSVAKDLEIMWEEMDLDQVGFKSRCLKVISLFTILAGACIAVLQASTTATKARYASVALGVLITASVTTQDTFFRVDFWTLDYVLEDAKATFADFRDEWEGQDLSDDQLWNKYRMERIGLRKKVREIKNRTRPKEAEAPPAQTAEVSAWERIFFNYAYAAEAPRRSVAPAWYGQPAMKGNRISVASSGFDPDLERSLVNARSLGRLLFLERLQNSVAKELAHRRFVDPAAQSFEATKRVMEVLGPYWNEAAERKDIQVVDQPQGGKGYRTYLQTEVDAELLRDIFVEFTGGVVQNRAAAEAIFGSIYGPLTQPMVFPVDDPARNERQALYFDPAVELLGQGKLEEAVTLIRQGLAIAGR